MKDDPDMQRLREGCQPKLDELTRGYPVTQPVNLADLKIPQNLGTAAVTPINGQGTSPTPGKSEK